MWHSIKVKIALFDQVISSMSDNKLREITREQSDIYSKRWQGNGKGNACCLHSMIYEINK